ncbi:MAG: hypothetical protein HQ567_04420 [Candidatus Nealsonbacteria bacterium]|nr:hypothetical protein [Candidatus Nealsonbacteria bacterium]
MMIGRAWRGSRTLDRPGHLMNLAAGRNAIRDLVEKTLERPSRRRHSRAMRFY